MHKRRCGLTLRLFKRHAQQFTIHRSHAQQVPLYRLQVHAQDIPVTCPAADKQDALQHLVKKVEHCQKRNKHHLLAIRQACPHSAYTFWCDLHVSVEGLLEDLLIEDRGCEKGVEVCRGFWEQLRQEADPHL